MTIPRNRRSLGFLSVGLGRPVGQCRIQGGRE